MINRELHELREGLLGFYNEFDEGYEKGNRVYGYSVIQVLGLASNSVLSVFARREWSERRGNLGFVICGTGSFTSNWTKVTKKGYRVYMGIGEMNSEKGSTIYDFRLTVDLSPYSGVSSSSL